MYEYLKVAHFQLLPFFIKLFPCLLLVPPKKLVFLTFFLTQILLQINLDFCLRDEVRVDRQTGRQTERQVGCFSRCLSSSFQLELSSADGPLLMAVRVSEVLQIATQTHTDAHSRTFIWATDNDRLAVCVLCSHLPPFSPRFFWPQLPSVLYPVSGSTLHPFYICIPH